MIEGGDKLLAYLADLEGKIAGRHLDVGFKAGKSYEDGTPIAAAAFWVEYGTSRQPARPFFRPMIANNSPDWGRIFSGALKFTHYDEKQALGILGQEIEGQLRDSILTADADPLSPVTLVLRDKFPKDHWMITWGDVQEARQQVKEGNIPGGHSKPRVWSGTMLNSVTSTVGD